MECTALDLLTNQNGDVCGIVCMWRETGTFTIFKAKSIIFATGGGGKAWDVTSNSWEYTGDGYAMAYEAGAELMDLEFNQFHPTGMVWPLSVKGLLVTKASGVKAEFFLIVKGQDLCSTMFLTDFDQRQRILKKKLHGGSQEILMPDVP